MGASGSKKAHRKEQEDLEQQFKDASAKAEVLNPVRGETLIVRRTLSYLCDGCRKQIKDDAPRYVCNGPCVDDQDSYDLCENCANLGHEHPLLRCEKSTKVVMGFETCPELLQNRFEAFSERRLFGIPRAPAPAGLTWMTYGEAYARARRLAAALSASLPPEAMVVVRGHNCADWYIVDYALIMAGFISVPIEVNCPPTAMKHMFEKTQPACVIATAECADGILDVLSELDVAVAGASEADGSTREGAGTDGTGDVAAGFVRRFLLMNDAHGTAPSAKVPAVAARLRRTGTAVETLDDVVDGAQNLSFVPPKRAPDAVGTIIWTSGSTGLPKGVVISSNVIRGKLGGAYGALSPPYTTFSFAPLALATERLAGYGVVGNGGRIVIHSGRSETLFEEVKQARPSTFAGPPRLFNELYSRYQSAVREATEGAAAAGETAEEAELKVRLEFGSVLGDHLQSVVTGGAPVSDVVLEWMRKTFRKQTVSVSYGTTEAGAIAVNGVLCSHVTAVLRDVPELGYFRTDTPTPRGELLVKTGAVCPGYFRDAENTSAGFDDAGFFRTGDVVEYDKRTARVTIIDRCKNFLKLSQGHFIAPEWIERTLIASPLVHSIYVYAEPVHPFPLAVVVPNARELARWAERRATGGEHGGGDGGKGPSLAELCALEGAKEEVLASLAETGLSAGLRPYEVPRAVVLESEPFTPENGLATPSYKLSRPGLLAKYRPVLRDVYAAMGNATPTGAAELYETMVRRTLGLPGDGGPAAVPADGEGSLADLGMDSLSGVRLKAVVKKNLNVDLPAAMLFSDATPADVARYIASRRGDGNGGTSAGGGGGGGGGDDGADLVGGEGVVTGGEANARAWEEDVDWEAEVALPAEVLEVVREAAAAQSAAAGTAVAGHGPDDEEGIFLTGATGFLGAFLLADILQHLPDRHVYCLVRETDEARAAARIADAFRFFDIAPFNASSDWRSRVTAVPGDLAKPLFGLEEAAFVKLASHVATVVHNGARVNGVAPYAALRAANVAATADAIRLCSIGAARGTRQAPARLVFVSSLSVFPRSATSESTPLRPEFLPVMGGYGASKVVAELLVSAAWAEGLDATIIRPGTISGATATGACSPKDFLARLLLGVVQMACVPDVVGADHDVVGHAPVDWVARASVALSMQSRPRDRPLVLPIYHLTHVSTSPTLAALLASASAASSSPLRTLPYHDWLALLHRSATDDNAAGPSALAPLVSYFSSGFPLAGRAFDRAATAEALAAAGVAEPQVDDALLARTAVWAVAHAS